MANVAVVTGAGSGVGQAIARALGKEGWQLALVGRRATALQETLDLLQQDGCNSDDGLLQPCDIAQPEQVTAMAQAVFDKFGSVHVLVNAAGTNITARSLEIVSLEDYRQVVETNLTGVYLCLQAFLPAMRNQHNGTIINIVSDAGLRASAKAGAAYAVSKFGLTGLTQTINAEEREHGVRACAIFPGDINTPLLDRRPAPPPAEARLKMLQAEDVAACAMLAINLPDRAIVEELLIRPR